MQHQARVSLPSLLEELKQAAQRKDVNTGRRLHLHAVQTGRLTNKYVVTALVTMYGKCRRMSDAWEVFDNVLQPDVVLWNSLILGYVDNGETLRALDCLLTLFNATQYQPDSVTFVAAFKSYGKLAGEQQLDKRFCLEKGLEAHKLAQELGFHKDKFVATNLMDMYSKCGSTTHSRGVFNCMTQRNVVSWTSLVLGYVENGQSHVAAELFMCADCEPDAVFFVAGFKACIGLVAEKRMHKRFCLEKGVPFHVNCRKLGFDKVLLVRNSLMDMYSKCGSMNHGCEVFKTMPTRDAVTWNTIIQGYVDNGEPLRAIDMFIEMTCERDSVTFVAALKACMALSELSKEFSLEKGLEVHKVTREAGYETVYMVANGLVEMYSKCGFMLQARAVFDKVDKPNVVLWTSLMLGYVENGEHLVALDVFRNMDCEPDSVTLIAGLRACAGLVSEKTLETCFVLAEVIKIQVRAKRCELDSDIYLANTLIEVYSTCRSIILAKAVFERSFQRNVVSWNNLIRGYVENEASLAALEVFLNLGCEPDSFTYAYALKSCINLVTEHGLSEQFCLEKGMSIHRELEKLGFDKHTLVSNALVEMYCRCGSISLAREVFNEMPQRDVVTYNILMLGCVEHEMIREALDLFTSMDSEPTPATFVVALKACGAGASLTVGRTIHAHIRRLGLEQNMMIATSLVDFYGKCGMMAAAEQVFSRIHSPDIVSWNALITGYSSLGRTAKVLGLVKRIQDIGLRMNETTFLLILTACSHAGEVDEGKKHFESIAGYGLTPTPEHYACLIDMLGRANRLHEALAVVRSMPFKANSVVWRTLLGACRKWNHDKDIALEIFRNDIN